MSMDLASFAAETKPSAVMERLEYDTKYDAPPKVDPGKGMRYVDTYIKVFYYPKKVRRNVQCWTGIALCLFFYQTSHSSTAVLLRH